MNAHTTAGWWWYRSPRKAMLAEDWVQREDREYRCGGVRFEVPFRLPEGAPGMWSLLF